MWRNLFLINLVLFIVAGFMGYKLYTKITASSGMPRIQNMEGVQRIKKSPRKTIPARTADSYEVVTSNNLFNPDRISEKNVQRIETAQLPKNQPKLFGTIIVGDKKTAIIQDPDSRITKIYGLNESVAGYLISDIQEDKVVLLWSGEEVVVRLREDKGVKAPVPPTQLKKPVRRATDTTSRRARQRRPRRTQRNVPPPPGAQETPNNPSPDINEED